MGCAKIISQLNLLMWKTCVMQKRQLKEIIISVAMPILFITVLAVIRTSVSIESKNEVIYPPFVPHDEITFQSPMNRVNMLILYAPNNTTEIRQIMDMVANDFKIRVLPFPTEANLENFYKNNSSQSITLAAVIFESLEEDRVIFKIRPKAIPPSPSNSNISKIFINWFTDYVFPLLLTNYPNSHRSKNGAIPAYTESGFLAVQASVSKAIIEVKRKKQTTPEVKVDYLMERFPYPAFLVDIFLPTSQIYIPVFIVFSFLYPIAQTVRNITREKETRIEEAMKIMGLIGWLNWTAAFSKEMILFCINSAIIVALLKIEFKYNLNVFGYSSTSLLFFVLVAYSLCSISMSIFISVFFTRSNSAAAATGGIFIVTFLPYFLIISQVHKWSFSGIIACCLLPNTAISMAFKIIIDWEGIGLGAQWSNMEDSIGFQAPIYLLILVNVMLLEAIILFILALYINEIFPKSYGYAKPWYFPLQLCFKYFARDDHQVEMNLPLGDMFEKEPAGSPGIICLGLKKVYGHRVAIHNLYLNAYDGQITVLLGHNGAGKTTTMSMIAGLITPSSGTAIINGYNLRTDINKIRTNFGICPQYNVLFDHLTVKEHLYFFCRLKGNAGINVESEIESMIVRLDLENKIHHFPHMLSGGMKRKLSVGCALIGGTRIILLDEPSSGMDPSARRFIWDLLLEEKKNRTILLTTQFMEEADVLGDRIAIMDSGKIQCNGSSLFLKKHYGVGYHMTVVKGANCNETEVIKLVQSYVPNAEIESNIGTELSFTLPSEASKHFEQLFLDLESKKNHLGFTSYGASVTTLEEVFLKVGEHAASKMKAYQNARLESPESKSNPESLTNVMNYEPVTGKSLIWLHFKTLVWKKWLFTRRNYALTFSQQLFPCIIIISALYMLIDVDNNKTEPRRLNLGMFQSNYLPIHSDGKPLVAKVISHKNVSTMLPNSTQVKHLKVKDFPNIEQALLSYAKADSFRYNTEYITAFALMQKKNRLEIKALFNTQAYHSAPISLSVAVNLMYNYYLSQKDSKKAKLITVINHPLPGTLGDAIQTSFYHDNVVYQMCQGIAFAFSFLIASFAVMLVIEKTLKVKHIQTICGVKTTVYWFSTLFVDIILLCIACFLQVACILMFQKDGLRSWGDFQKLITVYVISGLSGVPFVYLLSRNFKDGPSSYIGIALFNVVSAIASFLTVYMTNMKEYNLKWIGNVLDITFALLFPLYCFMASISGLIKNNRYKQICNHDFVLDNCDPNSQLFVYFQPCCRDQCGDSCLPWTPNYYDWPKEGIGRYLAFFSVQCVVYIVLLTLFETAGWKHVKKFFESVQSCGPCFPYPVFDPMQEYLVEDTDVQNERHRISNADLMILAQTDILIFYKLSKRYGEFQAVKELYLGITKGECFGLLGVNGAGKTTTFKMLTGDETITSGDAYLDGHSIKLHPEFVRSKMGYCPQFDALHGTMTGRETLIMYGQIKGIPKHYIEAQVKELSTMLYFERHLDKLVGNYSGGNKRKVSTAIALMGEPPIILLDEPSSGMDPVARRCLWESLLFAQKKGCSLLLTSHSMEECESLCNRLVIMVNGQFCCLGSPQYLKNKFSSGFSLIIKLSPPIYYSISTPEEIERTRQAYKIRIEDLKDYVEGLYPNAILKSSQYGYFQYYIAEQNVSWATIFGNIERAKAKYEIEDYSVGQTTLEQIFLNFAKVQT